MNMTHGTMAATMLAVLLLGWQAPAAARRPNVVLIVADDQGHAQIGYHNGSTRTPRIDALAAAGVKLENYYVMPVCSPTRSSLMTGRYSALFHKYVQAGHASTCRPACRLLRVSNGPNLKAGASAVAFGMRAHAHSICRRQRTGSAHRRP